MEDENASLKANIKVRSDVVDGLTKPRAPPVDTAAAAAVLQTQEPKAEVRRLEILVDNILMKVAIDVGEDVECA